MKPEFKSSFAENIFKHKYALTQAQTWREKARSIVDSVCGLGTNGKQTPILSKDERQQLTEWLIDFKWIPGGRYIYYAGREARFYSNCFALAGQEDTREEWGSLANRAFSCLMVGGGIGVDYSVFRPNGRLLSKTGGVASGPLPLAKTLNEIGRNVCQGGSRRSAIFASLNWQHDDIDTYLTSKDWHNMPIGKNGYTVWDAKADDFNYNAPLDMTNISVNYDDAWLQRVEKGELPDTYVKNIRQALKTGEPGMAFNFGQQGKHTLRNAPVCAETMILTAEGYRPVSALVGKRAEVWTGVQWSSDVVFTRTGVDVLTVKVSMTGGRVIRCDESHPFLVERYKWHNRTKVITVERVAASALKQGDQIVVSLPKAVVDGFSTRAYTLGFIYGDGSFRQCSSNAELSVCSEDKEVCLEYLDYSLVTSVNEHDNRGYIRVYFECNDLFNARNKAVFPVELFTAPTNEKVSFIAGLFDADGNYVADTNRVRLGSSQYDFLIGVRRLLESVGILSSINIGSKSGYCGRPSYTLVVSTAYVSEFASVIPTKRLHPVACKAYRPGYVKVESVVADGSADVYCADVGVPEHSFQAEGVLVSNCTEFVTDTDSDSCNLASVNIGAIDSIEELQDIVKTVAKFLICGSVRGQLPYQKAYEVRAENRRIGLGLMGMHEWLLRRNYPYEVVPELHDWLRVYKEQSEIGANEHCDRLYLARPKAYRAIAPTGTIAILAGTTSGIEPLFATAYKRRYLVESSHWRYEYVVDSVAELMVKQYDVNPDAIETAASMVAEPERRIKFQYDVQKYTDMAISSTLNLPSWGSEGNNEDCVIPFAKTLAKYAHGLRGFTCYPDGSRGGQPITTVAYNEAIKHQGVIFEENSSCKDGVCGI